MNQKPAISFLERANRPKLAYEYAANGGQNKGRPLLMFCSGFRSVMTGTKASYLAQECEKRGQPYLRFDYSGHGASSGNFEDGTIGDWARDAADVLDHVAQGPVVIAGSSMGGWIALLLARAQAERVKGVIGIAAAPDFTEHMFNTRLSEEQRRALLADGSIRMEGGEGEEPYMLTKKFYEEAKNNLLLTRPQTIESPLRLVHGTKDPDVPWETAVKIQQNYRGASVDIVFIEDGDHRLSRDEDLKIIDQQICILSCR